MKNDIKALISQKLKYRCPNCNTSSQITLKDTNKKQICNGCGKPFIVDFIASENDELSQEVLEALKEIKSQSL